jgi:hypothetical protein
MSALSTTPTGNDRRRVPVQARALAARLSALFDTDAGIVGGLNDAQHRLQDANDRLWSGLHPDALGLIYDGAAPAGHSQIATLINAAPAATAPGSEAALLHALQAVHWQVHAAFRQYQSACEERRQLAFEVGELSHQLTEVLCAAGWAAQQARAADVHQLATGAWRTAGHGEPGR